MLILKSKAFASVLLARSRATHLAGSQYITCESLYDDFTSMAGYALAATLSWGEYCRMYLNSAAFLGLPHSSNSPVVNGSDSSSMVLSTSTKGTQATTAWNRSGRRLVTAPIKRPPALPPPMASRSLPV